MKNIQVREATGSDFKDVMKIEKEAFGYEKEAELVSDLLEDKTAKPVISLLAFNGDEPVGHILFTRVTIDGNENSPSAYILAPLAVLPQYHRQGIGGALIREGLKRLKKMGVEIVFVLGHKEYYPGYGFTPGAESLGFAPPYPIPEKDADAWMVQALTSHWTGMVKGRVVCANALDKPEHWRE